MRVCDADREQVIAELRDRFAEGPSQESFVFRVDAVLRARWAELAARSSDLPPPRSTGCGSGARRGRG